MEILYVLASGFLIIFMVLAFYDGFYLHLWRFELFKRKESLNEHRTHSIRALLFPLVIYFYFLDETQAIYFYIGLVFILLDLIVLGMDAYFESESRLFMGGLPRWEYILHLFTNSFHFASICLITATKIVIHNGFVRLQLDESDSSGKDFFEFVCSSILPGAILLAILHLILMTPGGIRNWNYLKTKL